MHRCQWVLVFHIKVSQDSKEEMYSSGGPQTRPGLTQNLTVYYNWYNGFWSIHTDFSVSYSGIFYLPLFQQNLRLKKILLSETNFVSPLSLSIYILGVSCQISGL